jgi:hypothetical protein
MGKGEGMSPMVLDMPGGSWEGHDGALLADDVAWSCSAKGGRKAVVGLVLGQEAKWLFALLG